MNGLCHLLAVSAVLCLLLALASGYPLQQAANTDSLTEEVMERRSGNSVQHLRLDEILSLLDQYASDRQSTVKRQPLRSTGLNAIDNVYGMYYNDHLNKYLAALKPNSRRR